VEVMLKVVIPMNRATLKPQRRIDDMNDHGLILRLPGLIRLVLIVQILVHLNYLLVIYALLKSAMVQKEIVNVLIQKHLELLAPVVSILVPVILLLDRIMD
jgi:hypothetical protein